MFAQSHPDIGPASMFHELADMAAQHPTKLKVPQLQDSDEEFLLGLNEILDELHPTSDHGPLSGIGLHL